MQSLWILLAALFASCQHASHPATLKAVATQTDETWQVKNPGPPEPEQQWKAPPSDDSPYGWPYPVARHAPSLSPLPATRPQQYDMNSNEPDNAIRTLRPARLNRAVVATPSQKDQGEVADAVICLRGASPPSTGGRSPRG